MREVSETGEDSIFVTRSPKESIQADTLYKNRPVKEIHI